MTVEPSSPGGRVHAPPLARVMAVFGATLLTVSLITPAMSVFVVGSQVVSQAGSGAVLAFLAGGLVCIPMALIYAEVSSAFPVTGQEYSIVGAVLGPSWGFMALGINVVGGAFTQAVTALGLAVYLGLAIPGAPVVPTAIAAITLATLIGILNIRVNAIVTGLFLATELTTLGAITWLGAAHAHRGLSEILFHPTMPPGHPAASPLALIALGTSGAIFAYNGFGSAVSFGEEVHEATRKIAHVVLWSLVVAVLAEIVPVIGMVVGASDQTFAAETPFTSFIALGGPWFVRVIGIGVALAIINAIIATTLINARQIYAAGRDGVWPHAWNRASVLIHRRFRSPWVATLASGALSASMCFLPLGFLVTLTASGIVGTYILICLSALVGRRTGSTAGAHYKMPGFPFTPILALAAIGGVLVGEWLDPAGRMSLAWNLAIMIGFAAYYLVFLRGRGGWVLRGPDGDLQSDDL